MFLRQFTHSVLYIVFLVTSSLALSNTEFSYARNLDSIEILGCENICPLNLVIPKEIDGLPVTKIGWAAFADNQLNSVFIPNSVTTIDNLAFENNNLSSLVIPDTVITIGWLAFSNNNIEAVELSSRLKRIEDGVFLGNKLKDITIPNNVIFIGTDAFKNNEINSITLSDNLTLISSDAFAGNNIANLVIPSSVLSIDERAFFQNPLENITFIGDRPIVGKDVFSQVEEKYESFEGTITTDSCIDIFPEAPPTNPDGSVDETIVLEPIAVVCDTISYWYSDVNSEVVINFCDNNDGWPGESIFINEEQMEINCPTVWPSTCGEAWYKEVSNPELIDNCPITISGPINTNVNYSVFDIDQNGSFDALTDGLILLRYAFGLRGDSLIKRVIASDATRTTAEEIEAYIQSYLP